MQTIVTIRQYKRSRGYGKIDAAITKEQKLALEVAEAELTRKQAAAVLSSQESIAKAAPPQQETPKKPFGLHWDEELFNDIESLDCEATEKEKLRRIRQELTDTQKTLESKADQVTTWVEQAKKMQADIQARVAKKRKQQDPVVLVEGANTGGSQGPAAPGGGVGSAEASVLQRPHRLPARTGRPGSRLKQIASRRRSSRPTS